MYESKRFALEYEDYNENGKTPADLLKNIMEDTQFPSLEEIVIGPWGECWDDDEDGLQVIVDGIVENKDKFSHIKSLFFADMGYEECEVSWIIQADYSKFWEAMPQLEKLVIKGSSELNLGTIAHENLKHLEIICGGLPEKVISSVQKASLPALQKLVLYIGVEGYGFDGDIETIKEFLAESNFPKLTYLGLTDSEMQDEIAEAALASKYINQITTLDLSKGSLTDKGGQMLLEKIPQRPNIKNLVLEYHFMSEEMMEKLEGLSGVEVNVDDPQEADEFDGDVYYYPMLTE